MSLLTERQALERIRATAAEAPPYCVNLTVIDRILAETVAATPVPAAPLADAELADVQERYAEFLHYDEGWSSGRPGYPTPERTRLREVAAEAALEALPGLLARLAAAADVSRWVPESEARDGNEYRGLVLTPTGWEELPVLYRRDRVRRGWYHAHSELDGSLRDVRYVLLEAPRPAMPAAPTANAGKEPSSC